MDALLDAADRHRPIARMGAGTTRVGDPSGKDESRKILTGGGTSPATSPASARSSPIPEIWRWPRRRHHGQQRRLAQFAHYIDSCATSGRHFLGNRMLAFGSVKLRLTATELSFLEFQLHDPAGLRFRRAPQAARLPLQMGGSDQWATPHGIGARRRMIGAQLFALTAPLITTSLGAKMGKTAPGRYAQRRPREPVRYAIWRNTGRRRLALLKLFHLLPGIAGDWPPCRAQGKKSPKPEGGWRPTTSPGARP